jgi:hypothetical protein
MPVVEARNTMRQWKILPAGRTPYMSIDPRPKLQPDERGKDSHYVGNCTARMMAELSKHASPAEFGKLSTTEFIFNTT